MTPRDLLAWNVRKLRVQVGLSQERLALEAGLERVSISQLERKQVNLGIDSLGKIASVLNCKVFELLVEPAEGEQPPNNLRRGRRP
ncbi:helix-turn-helix transcriptional regulator [Agrobacterium rhizogenes]|uniref:helix-turn-helix domain-containing protein n=1 Tax=Rhizobium TaxID=379 RepID=UPI0009D92690|nr:MULTISPECIES: helix-turn-helix transcriptional regulator [Rhizobium]NTH79007.1 helix-turn-helix transcriptional regulator [Rhizobium rhizogenes]NTH85012.1 helix-turn-helix transcriptional regulator [Rhizobium rhizogenes]